MKAPRILIIPDKFKGSLDAGQAARAIRSGLLAIDPGIRCTLLPLSDGGEGFVQGLARTVRHMATIDPMGQPCNARYGLSPGKTAITTIAEASGFWRVPASKRNPGKWTTEGTGLMLARLASRDTRKIVVGFGGSITNEGGIGLAAPFGYRFLDRHGRNLHLNGGSMGRLAKIIPPDSLPKISFVAATDVENPLYGPHGAAFQFAKQKGATPAQIRKLDDNMKRLADVAGECLGRSCHQNSGAGAAGGAAYGLMTFLNAERVSGFDFFSETTGLESLIRKHDLVITGEGCLDETSMGGKGPWAVAQLARQLGKPVWAFCGLNKLPAGNIPFELVGDIMSLATDAEDSQKNATRHLRSLAKEAFKT